MSTNFTTFDDVFDNIPAGSTTVAHWNKQDLAILDAAARLIATYGANPWVFVADRQHFTQFADQRDKAALRALTDDQFAALCDWAD